MKAPTPTPILRFTTGKIVDYSTCPRRIQAHGHWRVTDEHAEPGTPNTTCECHLGDTTP